ncbi:hypothetical protein GEMRC1_009538 [Eukaryota sp. GEM-RC1]
MEHNIRKRTAVTSPSRGSDPPPHSFSSKAGEESHTSTLRPSHEEYELPSVAPFTAKIVNVAYSATEADIKQAFSSLHVKEVRSPSNMPGTFFVEFLDVQGLKQCLDKYWVFKIHGHPIHTYVASAPQFSVKPLNTSNISSKPNAEPKPLELLPLTSSFQTPSMCLRAQQSLLILIHVHLLKLLCKSALEFDYYAPSLHLLKFKDELPTFFRKVGYVSHRFFESALLTTKVFLQTNTFHVESEDLHQIHSFASFFGASISCVFLHVYGIFNVEEFLNYSNEISGLELEIENDNDLEFLNSASLIFPRLKQLHVSVDRSIAMALIELLKCNAIVTSARSLAEVLNVNTTVTSVNLWWNSIGDDGVRALSEALKANETVSNINLGGNLIGIEGARLFAEALKVNNAVTSIVIKNNFISDEGATALAEALKVNTSVKSINLSTNSIGDHGFIDLAEALKVNTTITSVNLSSNYVGDLGTRALAEALKVNTTIKDIELDNNSIGDDGARALADALIENVAVTSINLGANSIGDEGVSVLANALIVNRKVKILGVYQLP